MSKSTADRQMIQLAIVFVCLISSSFEAKTKSKPELRSQESLADSANCGSDERVALDDILGVCAPKKWPGLTKAKDKCCFWMNAVCANSNYIRVKCSPKSDFDQKVKDARNMALDQCANNRVTWSESLCNFGKAITGDCQKYKTYLDCKDFSTGGSPVNPSGNQPGAKPPVNKDTDKSSGLSLRYPAVTELLLVALLIKYFI